MNYSQQPYDDDLPNQPWSQRCTCGSEFMQPNSYALHVGCCRHFKAHIGKNLKLAKERRTQGPSKPQENPSGLGKRKFSWIDDEDLDVDCIPTPPHTKEDTPLPNSPAVEEPAEQVLGRGLRQKELSYKIQPKTNFLPSSALPASLFPTRIPPAAPSPAPETPANSPSSRHTTSPHSSPTSGEDQARYTTKPCPPNEFGLYKIVSKSLPDTIPHDPDDVVEPSDLRDDSGETVPAEKLKRNQLKNQLYPFPNLNAFMLGDWYWSDGNGRGKQSFERLLEIIGDDSFNPADIQNVDWTSINKILASSEDDPRSSGCDQWAQDGSAWLLTPVYIDVPLTEKAEQSGPHRFTIDGFRYRPLVPIIREKLQSSTSQEYFHTSPHELRWRPGTGKADCRVYGEMYNSPAFLKAFIDLQNSPPEKNCEYPRYVIGLMFASDATMLASFGTAKLWPLYMFYANDSKYRRSKLSEKLFETVAYFEKLPDDFKDFVINLSGKRTVPQPLITHCQRELFHEQWKIILDDEFIESYCHGIVVKCYDGEHRRFYPRIFTILLASIKNLGAFPCPRCEIPMTSVPAMGQKRDRRNRVRLARVDSESRRANVSEARKSIYIKHRSVTSDIVEARLAQGSLVPTDNAFSRRLSPHGFDLFPMLVVDLMHEVELGVWKALFIQLLRILQAHDKGLKNKLDKRYRSMPTFGKDVIRRFVNNASDMKHLAARDYEDLLQCAIPAFEGLLPRTHNQRIMELLYTFASWHGLAKLRLHTDHTLTMLDELTTTLGDQLRSFVKLTCSQFETQELSREYQARKRREARKKKTTSSGKAKGRRVVEPETVEEAAGDDLRRKKTLNLNTYKFHSLGDVVTTIRMFGTTDSYSTQTPEGFHRFHKAHYKRTSKKDVSRQLSRIQMRQTRIQKLRKKLFPDPDENYVDADAFQLPYFIGKSQNHPVSLPTLVQSKSNDPAIKGFIPKLKAHLLPRIYSTLLQEDEPVDCGPSPNSERIRLLKSLVKKAASDLPTSMDTMADVEQIYFHSDRIYQHSVFNINYTSYDVRRQTDIVNPKTPRQDVMCIRSLDADEDPGSAHRFVYARVLGIYHTNVIYKGRGAKDLRKRRFDFLFVRWFKFCDPVGWNQGLDRLKLAPLTDPNAIGFLDPNHVLRASHIVPRFSKDRLYPNGTGRIVSKLAKDADDWTEYFINRFVDRDMLMRYYWGHGVGHMYAHSDAPEGSDEDGGVGQAQSAETKMDTDQVDLEEGNVAGLSSYRSQGEEYSLENLEEEELDIDSDSDSGDSNTTSDSQEMDDSDEE